MESGIRFRFHIDVIGACNVRCPTCPVGNFPEAAQAQGLMTPELLDRILAKARSECVLDSVGLYNWTEPLLHPRIADLVRIVHSHGVPCLLSANLNLARNLEALLKENPEFLRVTVSGFTQETYGITHKRGQIERVKANMTELARVRTEVGARTGVQVGYLRYLTNLHEEQAMRQFAEGLGFEFLPMWAFMLPLEKVLGYRGEPGFEVPTAEDRRTINMLALPLDEALDAARLNGNRRCGLLENQVAMDVKGDVQLCCNVYDPAKYTIANFLDTPLERIQGLRHAGTTCAACMKHGAHDYYVGAVPNIEGLAHHNIARRGPQAAGSGAVGNYRVRKR
jgi:MoaA/NifB/PqqE/SkfB family radical SAM enzyme